MLCATDCAGAMSCFKASQESAAIEAGCNSQLITGNEAGNTSVIDSVESDLVSINVQVKAEYMIIWKLLLHPSNNLSHNVNKQIHSKLLSRRRKRENKDRNIS